jgi:hypothetical protein
MTDEMIEKVAALLQKTPLEESHVVHLFVLARKLLERVPGESRGQFRTLEFYCHWTMHAELDRKGASLVIARLQEIVWRHLEPMANNASFSEEVSGTLSLGLAREEFNRLLRFHAPDSKLNTDERWDDIVGLLLLTISGCPLTLRGESTQSNTTVPQEPKDAVIKSVEMILVKNIELSPKAAPDDWTVCVQLTVRKKEGGDVRLRTPLAASAVHGTFR